MAMPDPELLDAIRKHATLGSIPDAEAEWLATHGVRQHLEPGALLTKAGGAAPAGLYILFEGHVVIHVDRGTGAKKASQGKAPDKVGHERDTGADSD